MIYQQHSVEADVPAMRGMALPAGSLSCFCLYAEAVAATDLADSVAATAAASSGSCCFSAAVAAMATDLAAAAAVAAKDSCPNTRISQRMPKGACTKSPFWLLSYPSSAVLYCLA